MNLESMPSTQFYVQEDGYLPVEWQNWFSINSQNMQLFFANTGHLVPSRTNSDIQALSNVGSTDPTMYKARSLYNNDTSNFMGNVNGVYLNYTMNNLTTRANILSMASAPNTLQFFGDENKLLYANVNGSTNQVPINTATSTATLNFKVDGSGNLYATINGVDHQIQLI